MIAPVFFYFSIIYLFHMKNNLSFVLFLQMCIYGETHGASHMRDFVILTIDTSKKHQPLSPEHFLTPELKSSNGKHLWL